MKKENMDGCTAAAYIAYAFSEVATIYPITPIAEMGETADKWRIAGLRNLLGTTMEVREMESELGAAGATHGALGAGALATTFTSSQGLMLMIPNMYKISGELLPGVFHVGCRSLAAHALSIFGDHQDVMACRATGFAMLASNSVQETHDLAIVSHIAALRGSLPVLHFFDGWRTSNETATIDVASYDELQPLLPVDAVRTFRRRGMNPEHPDLRGSAQNSDVYFQNREAPNAHYLAMPGIVQQAMDDVGRLTGRQYHIFDYVGHPEATDVIVTMGSSAEVAQYTIDYLNANGGRYGMVKVRLYRPFSPELLLQALPASVKRIAVLDRTKEPGSHGEPLYLDVVAAVQASGREISVIGGRYGLGSKNFDPTMVRAVFANLAAEKPIHGFTVGINDDVTHLSLSLGQSLNIPDDGDTQVVFYGMGSDGTVGATRVASRIITGNTDLYSQVYFQYSAKKSGGYTVCQLRFGPKPITKEFSIEHADYVGCNKSTYVRRFDLVDNLVDGGTFVLNSTWSAADMEVQIPATLKRALAAKHARFYNVNALKIAESNNLGVRINMIMLAAFFKLQQIIPYETAVKSLEEYITTLYKHEGDNVVANNIAAVSQVADAIVEIPIPTSWATATDGAPLKYVGTDVPKFVENVAQPCDRGNGNRLPVSAFTPDGIMPMGTTAYEKRTIADNIPAWDPDKCVQCTQCSLVCAHASIRPYVLDAAEAQGAPAGFDIVQAKGKDMVNMKWRIQVYPQDCTGCGSCAVVCPGHALEMTPIASLLQQQIPMLDYARQHVTEKSGLEPRATIRGSQFYRPLLEFSGACAGCGETPYVKLLTQLMGERMVIANATGCSSIWGANYPSNAYCTNANGQGPAWGNSLFEDNAEYAYGIATAIAHRRNRLADLAQTAIADNLTKAEVKSALQAWLDARTDAAMSRSTGDTAIASLKANPETKGADEMLEMSDLFAKKSIWAIGGDGWAYDIGFAGLDHVLAQNIDINMLVMDTECYSNTGGQTSKATPISAVMKYAADGKDTYKKDLGRMMMTYPDIYVASVSLGANYQQTINALVEADAHPGPSIVIAYCPCINHGIRTGMSHSIIEEKEAVLSGYWPLYRYNPAKTPALTVDNPAPSVSVATFTENEDRYANLSVVNPDNAAKLSADLADRLLTIRSLLLYNAAYVPQK